MSYEEPTYEITAQASGEKFYNGSPIIGIAAVLSIESSQSATAGKIQTATSALSIESSLQSSAGLIHLAESTINVGSIVTSASIEILNAIVIASASATLLSTARRVVGATSSMSIDSTLQSSGSAIRQASSSVSAESQLSSLGLIIKLIQANLAGSTVVLSEAGEILLADGSISISSRLFLADLVRFTPSIRYPGSIVSLIEIDGKQITAQNRDYSLDINQVKVEKINWNSKKSRYYKSNNPGKIVIKLSWEWLPSKRYHTVDGREARDFIKEIASDMDSHVVKIFSYGEDSEDLLIENTYNVFVKSYSEDILRRDLSQDIYFYKCDIELEEV